MFLSKNSMIRETSTFNSNKKKKMDRYFALYNRTTYYDISLNIIIFYKVK